MTTYGIFEDQPAHLLSNILERAPYDVLTSLAKTSKAWFQIVRRLVTTSRFQKRALERKQFYEFGKLIGTISDPTDYEMLQCFLKSISGKESEHSCIGNVVRGFCSSSRSTAKEKTQQLFAFTWNLVGNLDGLMNKVIKDYELDALDFEEDENEELEELMENRIMLRRQLHALFLSNTSSPTYGYFLLELIKKVGTMMDGRQEEICKILHIVLNPTVTYDEFEFINLYSIYSVDSEEVLDNIERFAEVANAFRALQKACISKEDNELCAGILNEFMSTSQFWTVSGRAAIFALEPCLLSWFLIEHSYFVIMGFEVSKILVEMSMIMQKLNSEKLNDLKTTLSILRKRFLKEEKGSFHLDKMREKIERAQLIYLGLQHPVSVINNKFTDCLRPLINYKTCEDC